MDIILRTEAKANGLAKYFTGNPCKYGHVAQRNTSNGECCECSRIRRSTDYSKELARNRVKKYNQNNKDKIKARKKAWNENNKDKIKEYGKVYREANLEKIKSTRNRYLKENSQKVSASRKRRYEKNKKKENSKSKEWKLNNPLNQLVRRTLARIESRTRKNVKVTEIDLGYTQSEFKKHIESQFKCGMSWRNRSEWHIDHIIPVSYYLKKGVTCVKTINALDNLQPLWAGENQSKGSKLIKPHHKRQRTGNL